MKGEIDGIKGPGFLRNARIIARFLQIWHKGVAKGSSDRQMVSSFHRLFTVEKGRQNSSVLLLTGIFKPWPVDPR
jgi:hypothetical protein